MKIEIEITRKVAVTVALLVACSVYGYFFIKDQIFPYNQFFPVARSIFRYAQTVRLGKDKYVEAQLSKQRATASGDTNGRTIETSQLPLKLQFLSLGKVQFPEAGGAIADVNQTLVVMSRVGEFYKVSGDGPIKLDYGVFPNGLREYILHSEAGLNSDSLRAHSFAYDAANRRLVVAYTRYVSSQLNKFVISMLAINPDTLQKRGDWKDIFESEDVPSSYPSQAGAGRVIVDKGKIYFSTGYAEIPTKLDGAAVPAAQNPNSSFGKIFVIDPATQKVHLLSLGFRNAQGLAVLGQDLLATEQGPEGGDEINLIREGKNYGWPYTTYGTDYGAYDYKSEMPPPKRFVSEDPVYAFVPSVSLSPLHVVKGFHPRWDGDLLAGSLKAQSLFRIIYKSGRVIVSEPIWIGRRIRDITQSPRNRIVLLTDDGYLIFVSVDEEALRNNNRNAGYNFEPKLARCLVCHQFEPATPSSLAPSLAHVVGRRIGGDTFAKYSSALQHAKGTWDVDNLAKFIADPQSVIPGTAMPKPGVSESEADDIAKILSRQ